MILKSDKERIATELADAKGNKSFEEKQIKKFETEMTDTTKTETERALAKEEFEAAFTRKVEAEEAIAFIEEQ